MRSKSENFPTLKRRGLPKRVNTRRQGSWGPLYNLPASDCVKGSEDKLTEKEKLSLVHGQVSWYVGARQKWTAAALQPHLGWLLWPAGESFLLMTATDSTSGHPLGEEREDAWGKDAQRLMGSGHAGWLARDLKGERREDWG